MAGKRVLISYFFGDDMIPLGSSCADAFRQFGPDVYYRVGSWKRGPPRGTSVRATGRPRVGKATNGGWGCQAEFGGHRSERGTGPGRLARWPRLHEHRIGYAEVVKEGFVGPLAGRVRLQAVGRIRRRAEAGR